MKYWSTKSVQRGVIKGEARMEKEVCSHKKQQIQWINSQGNLIHEKTPETSAIQFHFSCNEWKHCLRQKSVENLVCANDYFILLSHDHIDWYTESQMERFGQKDVAEKTVFQSRVLFCCILWWIQKSFKRFCVIIYLMIRSWTKQPFCAIFCIC